MSRCRVTARIRSWWKHLGYCNGQRQGKFRSWGIRFWRGAPFFWFVVDKSSSAKQSDGHYAECEECAAPSSSHSKS